MNKRGPKSAAELSIASGNVVAMVRVRPPASLSAAEAETFRTVVASVAADHFAPGDVPVLVTFVQAIMLNAYAMKEMGDGKLECFPIWEKSSRVIGAMATKLRLVPQARIHPEKAGRRALQFNPSPYDAME
jgi:hypothetical protein